MPQTQSRKSDAKLLQSSADDVCRLSHLVEAERLDGLTEWVPNVQPNFGRMLYDIYTNLNGDM